MADPDEPLEPGWHPDPLREGRERRWDGSGWTDETRNTAPDTDEAPQRPGWYIDPLRPDRERRWDGSEWTDHTRQPPPPPGQPTPSQAPVQAPPAPAPPAQPPPRDSYAESRRAGAIGGLIVLAMLLGAVAWEVIPNLDNGAPVFSNSTPSGSDSDGNDEGETRSGYTREPIEGSGDCVAATLSTSDPLQRVPCSHPDANAEFRGRMDDPDACQLIAGADGWPVRLFGIDDDEGYTTYACLAPYPEELLPPIPEPWAIGTCVDYVLPVGPSAVDCDNPAADSQVVDIVPGTAGCPKSVWSLRISEADLLMCIEPTP